MKIEVREKTFFRKKVIFFCCSCFNLLLNDFGSNIFLFSKQIMILTFLKINIMSVSKLVWLQEIIL